MHYHERVEMAAQEDEGRSAAELVRSARQRRGLSQRALAERAQVPQSTVAKIETGKQQPSVAMLERLVAAAGFTLDVRLKNARRPSELLVELADEVRAVLATYPVAQAWVFGSAARGDDRPDSDLDLLVELQEGASFEDYVGLDEELAATLGCPVDVVTTREMDSNELLRRRVRRDIQRLDLVA
jgi:predicted nucleotidyltransferase/DNA-binding XRE family transcriptional regulator